MNKLFTLGCVIFILIILCRFIRHWTNFKHLVIFIICPGKIAKISAEDAIKKRLKDEAFKKRFDSDQAYHEKEIAETEDDFVKRIDKLENSIRQGFITVMLVAIASAISVNLFKAYFSFTSDTITITQIVSVFLILWALISKLGWPIQTFKGNTIPEQIDNFWFILLNVVGTYLLFTTYFYGLIK